MRTPSTTMKVPKELVERIRALQRPRQALAGVIEELLNGTIPIKPETVTRLESFKTSPIETLDDLINNLIDEVKEKKAC